MKIYHSKGTRSVRPIWLCYELGVEPEIETVPFTPDFLQSEHWRAISPAGKLPILEDGDIRLFESGAMVEYILDEYGNDKLRPVSNTKERALYIQWCWFAEATLSRPLGLNPVFREESLDALHKVARKKAVDAIQVVETALAGQEYIVDNQFSAADIMLGYSLGMLSRFKLTESSETKNITAYLERLMARPAYKRIDN